MKFLVNAIYNNFSWIVFKSLILYKSMSGYFYYFVRGENKNTATKYNLKLILHAHTHIYIKPKRNPL